MPLIKINLLKGRSEADLALLLDTVHDVVVSAFRVPERDRYQIALEHDPSHFHALDTGLDLKRTNKFVLVEVISRPRERSEKLTFYHNLAAHLEARCLIPSSDVMVSFVENTDEDWSFGGGVAQFVTGEL